MNKLSELYEKLNKFSDFNIDDNSEMFLDTVDEIVKFNDIESISRILCFFDDNSDYSWVLESTSNALEHYSMEKYVRGLISNLSFMIERCPIWADSFFNKIFNSDTYRDYFINNIHLSSKESLLKLFDIMEKESPHHRNFLNEIRKRL